MFSFALIFILFFQTLSWSLTNLLNYAPNLCRLIPVFLLSCYLVTTYALMAVVYVCTLENSTQIVNGCRNNVGKMYVKSSTKGNIQESKLYIREMIINHISKNDHMSLSPRAIAHKLLIQ